MFFCPVNMGKYFFAQCVIGLWNSLPQDIIMVSSLNVFKKELDKFIEEKTITSYKA